MEAQLPRPPSPHPAPSFGRSNHSIDNNAHAGRLNAPAMFPFDYPVVFKTHFDELSHYLTAYLAKAPLDVRSSARKKLVRLTVKQFYELSTDVYDEVMRRRDESTVPFLPLRPDFHPKRNQARQKLATLPIARFEDLSGDVHFELSRRYPEFKEDLKDLAHVTPGLLALKAARRVGPPEPGVHARRIRSSDPGDPGEKMRREYEFKIAAMQSQITSLQRDLGDAGERLGQRRTPTPPSNGTNIQNFDASALNDDFRTNGADSAFFKAGPTSLQLSQQSSITPSKALILGVPALPSHDIHVDTGATFHGVPGLPGEEPPENVKAIVARLAAVFENVARYRQLLSHKDSEAQLILNSFQMLLDIPGLPAKFRRNLLVATQRLSTRAGLYPICLSLDDVELASEHPLAAGSYADIYKGRYLGQAVCLKVIRLYQTSQVNSFLKQFSAEAILWGQLSHPNLLRIYGLYRYTARPCLVSPWMEHGDVNNFLKNHPDANRILLVLDVASGIAYLHEHDIVHGDLKGANILISDSRKACLADFGLSAVSDQDILHWTSHSSAASKGGSVRWQAPELFDTDTDDIVHNSKPSDVYAFGCVVYEIFTGNIPFYELPRDPAVIRKVQTGAQPSRPPASSLAWGPWGLTEPFWSLMQACWSADPDKRPSIADVLNHRDLEDIVDVRPVEDDDNIARARFRDSMSARSDLPSIDAIAAILDGLDPEL